MLILTHFLISLILALGLFPIYKWYVLIIPIVGTAMDLDHFPAYFIKFKNLNLIKAYNYFKGETKCKDLAVLHTVELLIILFIFSFYNRIILIVFLTMLLHMVLDLIDAVINKKKRPFSIIQWLINRKTKAETYLNQDIAKIKK